MNHLVIGTNKNKKTRGPVLVCSIYFIIHIICIYLLSNWSFQKLIFLPIFVPSVDWKKSFLYRYTTNTFYPVFCLPFAPPPFINFVYLQLWWKNCNWKIRSHPQIIQVWGDAFQFRRSAGLIVICFQADYFKLVKGVRQFN